jgi:DNA-binding transcriptional MerR regulator
MGEIKTYRLKKLSAITGVPVRTIRSYIEQGLVPGPETMGRDARYTEQHRRRIEQVKLLKEVYGLPMREIRRRLLTEGDFPEPARPLRPVATSPPESRKPPLVCSAAKPPRWAEEADDDDDMYAPPKLSGLKSMYGGGLRKKLESLTDLPPGLALYSPVARLSRVIANALQTDHVQAGAHVEQVTRIEVTRDIALEIKGDYSPAELALLRRLAETMRAALLHGVDPGKGVDRR